MEKITKKELKKLHDSNKLLLVAAVEKNKSDTLELIKKFYDENKNTKTTKLSAEGNKIIKITAYKHIINDKVFYFLESINDSSKDRNCSWDDITVSTVVYILK